MLCYSNGTDNNNNNNHSADVTSANRSFQIRGSTQSYVGDPTDDNIKFMIL